MAYGLGLTPQAVSSILHRGNVHTAASKCESVGVVPYGAVTSYAERLGLTADQRVALIASPALWPLFASGLGISNADGEPARFDRPADAIIAAEALVAAINHARREPWSDQASISDDFGHHAQAVAPALFKLAAGPYGHANDATRLLTELSLVLHKQLVAAIDQTPLNQKLIRPLDRAIRLNIDNASLRHSLEDRLATPPKKLLYRHLWMRGLRRLMWADLRERRKPKWWAVHQLYEALRGERAYEHISLAERVSAAWILVEASGNRIDDEGDIQTEIRRDPDLAWLAAPAQEAIRWMSDGRNRSDLVRYRPEAGWGSDAPHPDLTEKHPWLLMDEVIGAPKAFAGTKGLEVWNASLHLLREAVLSPCAVRHRGAADAVVAAGTSVSEACVRLLGGLYADLSAEADEPHVEFLRERTLLLIGHFRSSAGSKYLRDALHEGFKTASTARQAVKACADIASKHQDVVPDLQGWVDRTREDWSSDPMEAAAVYFAGVAGLTRGLPNPPSDAVLTQGLLAWHADFVGDPWRLGRSRAAG